MKKIYNNHVLTERRRELRKQATQQEALLWARLRGRQLGLKFRRQHSIGNFIVDFYCPAIKFVIELDGAHHLLENIEYDQERDSILRDLGCIVLRISNNEVDSDFKEVIRKIKVAVEPFSR